MPSARADERVQGTGAPHELKGGKEGEGERGGGRDGGRDGGREGG